jgi:predicted transport protein
MTVTVLDEQPPRRPSGNGPLRPPFGGGLNDFSKNLGDGCRSLGSAASWVQRDGSKPAAAHHKEPNIMDNASAAMIANLKDKTGKSLDEWKAVISKQNLAKHGEIVKFLKGEHNVTHGYASEIALKVLGSDAASAADTDELVETQYKGKEHLRPFYDKILAEVAKFGGEFEIAPKKAYVSLKRKKQFVTLTPASKTRFDIGFNLKGVEPSGKLEAEKPNGICSHKISVADISDIDAEVISWIKQAFDKAV